MHHSFKLTLITSLILTAPVVAEENFRQHEAHVHGHVELNIAQDGNELLFEISAPGSDVVGFEHSPENDDQHELIEQAEKTFANVNDIFILPAAAKCKIEHVDIKNSLESHEGHDEHEKHEDHEKHESHESHEGHEGHEGHEEKGGHGEFNVEYHFDCEDINKVSQIETKWFELFPNTQEIEVNLLTDKTQKLIELTVNNHVIKL